MQSQSFHVGFSYYCSTLLVICYLFSNNLWIVMKQNQLVKTRRLSQVPLWGYVYSTNCALEALGDFSLVVSVSGYLCCFAGCSFVIFKRKKGV